MRKLFGPFSVVLSLLALSLPAIASVTGTVVTQDGKPIPNAKVLSMQYSNTGPKYQLVYTNKKGLFTCDFRPSTLVAVAQGYSFGNSNPDSPRSKGAIRIVLLPERVLRGKVVDSDGQPIAGVTVAMQQLYAFDSAGNQIQFDGDRGTPDPAKEPTHLKSDSVTSKDGSFALHHIPDHTNLQNVNVQLRVSKPGRALIKRYLYSQLLDQELVIRDPEACKIEGSLLLPDKSTPAPQDITLAARLTTNDDLNGQTYFTSTKQNGRFDFPELAPGKYTITMSIPERSQDMNGMNWVLPAVNDLDIKANAVRRLDLVGIPGIIAKGLVVDSKTGKPFARTMLTLTDACRPEESPFTSAQCNDKGEFAVLVPPGDVKIGVTYCMTGQMYANFQSEDIPTASFVATEGKDKTDIVIKVDPSASSSARYQEQGKGNVSIPADFELTPGEYPLTWDTMLTYDNAQRQPRESTIAEVASHIKKLPTMVSSHPQVMEFQLDGKDDSGLLFIAVDESKGTGKGYDTVYVDTNRNTDLSDEKGISFNVATNSSRVLPSIDVQSSHKESTNQQDQHFIPVILRMYQTQDFGVYMIRKGCWVGAVDSSKGKVQFAITDTNMNGDFNDPVLVVDGDPRSPGDTAFVDTNGAGRLFCGYESRHRVQLNEAAEVNGKLYRIRFNDLANTVSVQRYDGLAGTIIMKGESISGLNGNITDAALVGQNTYYPIHDCAGTSTALPVGKYKIASCTINLKTKSGSPLKVSCMSTVATEIKPNELTTAVISGKITGDINPDDKEVTLTAGTSNRIIWLPKIGNTTKVITLGDYRNDYRPRVEFFDSKNLPIYKTTAGFT